MMGNSRVLAIVAGAIAFVVIIVAYSALFVVDQTHQAIVLQLGEFKSVIRDPGLHVKLPFIQDVVYYDNRVLDAEPATEEVIASDQKRLVVDGFARFRIADPLLFYKSVGTEAGARPRLNSIISASLRRVLGNVTLASVLSAERSNIMKTITEETRVQAKPFGIEVLDVRLRRADLPEENNQAVYARMQSERQREAQEFRAQGDEFAQRIRATAERERTVILAEAQRQSDILRGQGEAESTTTYAEAFGKDPNFFSFYRSMQAYRTALEGNNTTFVLTPDNDFFRFFGNPGTAPGAPAAAGAPPVH